MKKSFSLYVVLIGVLVAVALVAIVGIFVVGCSFTLGLTV